MRGIVGVIWRRVKESPTSLFQNGTSDSPLQRAYHRSEMEANKDLKIGKRWNGRFLDGQAEKGALKTVLCGAFFF